MITIFLIIFYILGFIKSFERAWLTSQLMKQKYTFIEMLIPSLFSYLGVLHFNRKYNQAVADGTAK